MTGGVEIVCGLFLLATAAWNATHETWPTRADRAGYRRHPTRLRRANLTVSIVLARVLVPLALLVLGIAAVIAGVARL